MTAIQTAIDTAGSQAALAKLLAVTQATVAEWASGRRPIPPDRCHEIERAVHGAATCEELRADIFWHRVPDKSWPWHPRGRPTIDVARRELA